MQVPTTKMSSPRMRLLGVYHIAALLQNEATLALAEAFRLVLEALEAAWAATQLAEVALIPPRVAVSFSEANVQSVLRTLSLRAQVIDNNSARGPAKAALFPHGLNAAVSVRGTNLRERAQEVHARLMNQPAVESLRAELAPVLVQAIGDLETKLAAYREALNAYNAAVAAELGARERFVAAYDADAGVLRQMFPRDRARQDLYFDTIDTRRSSDSVPPPKPTDGGNPQQG